MAAGQLTIEQMRQMLQRLDQAKGLEENIPQAYIDRLERSAQLLDEYRKTPGIDWDNIRTVEEIERAEATIKYKLELKNDIERHFATCGLTVGNGGSRRGRKPATAARTRQPRRSKEQIEFDLRIAEISKGKREELGLPPRGRISEEDKAKLNTAIEKEIKKQKLAAPRS